MTDVITKVSIGGQVVPFGGGLSYTEWAGIDITSNEISVDTSTAPYDNTTSGATATNVQDALDEVFQSVSNGKGLIADAITDKGVSTSASDSFQTMADNIDSLMVGGKYTSDSLWDMLYRYRLVTNIVSIVTPEQIENWDSVYYYCSYTWASNTNSRALFVKYNKTKKKIYKYFCDSFGWNESMSSIQKDQDKVWFVKFNYNLTTDVPIWYFDENNVFVATSTWAWTLTDIGTAQSRNVWTSDWACLPTTAWDIRFIASATANTYDNYVYVSYIVS